MTYIVTISQSQIEVFRGSRNDAARWARELMRSGDSVSMRREIFPSQYPCHASGCPRFHEVA